MKQYRLIKKLPFEGSPEIGYISTEKVGEAGAHYWNHNWFYPEDYHEYWELVVEKDYEILTYIGKFSKNILFATIDPYVLNDKIAWNDKHLDIHSIKRLSDGEIFTVGDKVDGSIKKNVLINKLTLSEDKSHVRVWGDFIYGMTGWNHLAHINHSKTPLFITDDGVEKFEGDTCFFITPTQYSLGFGSVILGSEFKFALVRFNDQKKANAWIEENKPQYSKKDIIDFAMHVPTNLYENKDVENWFNKSWSNKK